MPRRRHWSAQPARRSVTPAAPPPLPPPPTTRVHRQPTAPTGRHAADSVDTDTCYCSRAARLGVTVVVAPALLKSLLEAQLTQRASGRCAGIRHSPRGRFVSLWSSPGVCVPEDVRAVCVLVWCCEDNPPGRAPPRRAHRRARAQSVRVVRGERGGRRGRLRGRRNGGYSTLLVECCWNVWVGCGEARSQPAVVTEPLEAGCAPRVCERQCGGEGDDGRSWPKSRLMCVVGCNK